MEHLSIWFEDTTQTLDRGPQGFSRAAGLPIAALTDLMAQLGEGQVFAYRLAAPEVLSAVCLTVPSTHAGEDVMSLLRHTAEQQGTFACVRSYNEPSYQAGWDEGTPLFPGQPNGPTILGPLPGTFSSPAGVAPDCPDLSLMLATLDELASPTPQAKGDEMSGDALTEGALRQVVNHVVTHTAEEGHMVPWPKAAAALQQVLAQAAAKHLTLEQEAQVSPARKHYELMQLHSGLTKADRWACSLVGLSLLLGGAPVGLAVGAGWWAGRKVLEARLERSPRLRTRLRAALCEKDPTLDTSPRALSIERVPFAPVNTLKRLERCLHGHPQQHMLMAWAKAWWPLHAALVTAYRRPPLSLDHPSRWRSVDQEAMMSDLADPFSHRPLSPTLQRAANRYREAIAPWLPHEGQLKALLIKALEGA